MAARGSASVTVDSMMSPGRILPRIDETIESLAGAEWFSTLEIASGYWQVTVELEDCAKPFGLAKAPATFLCLMEIVLRGIN